MVPPGNKILPVLLALLSTVAALDSALVGTWTSKSGKVLTGPVRQPTKKLIIVNPQLKS